MSHFETALLALLYRFSRPRRLRPEMEKFFGMRLTKISSILQTITEAMDRLARLYLHNPRIYRNRMPLYARKIYQKIGLLDNIWGFIDGTLRQTCRPSCIMPIVGIRDVMV